MITVVGLITHPAHFTHTPLAVCITPAHTCMQPQGKGKVSKLEWAEGLRAVLDVDIPFLSYAGRLVEEEADSSINYAK